MPSQTHLSEPGGAAFSATHWSMVLAARGDDSDARAALEKLCRTYWFPLYAFLRRSGLAPHDAEDATQSFLADLLGRGALEAVDRERGKFRSFLLAALRHHQSHARERAAAQKRGGGLPAISFDALDAEQRYAIEPADELSPDKLFDRQWALTILARAQARLAAEYESAGKAALFEALRPTLTGARESARYTSLGERLGLSEGAVKVAVHRFRERYRASLRAEVAETVGDAAEVDAELRHLIAAL